MNNADLRVIMIDDDMDDIYITARRLSDSNLEAEFVFENDPHQLFDLLIENHIDGRLGDNLVVLLDINMPDISGLDVLQQLRSDERFRDVPVLMLCTSDDARDMMASYDVGADGYLTKPIVTDEMLGFVSQLGSNHSPTIH